METVTLTRQSDGAWLCHHRDKFGERYAARRTLTRAKSWGRAALAVDRATWSENGPGDVITASIGQADRREQ